jgi:hypothetical protein
MKEGQMNEERPLRNRSSVGVFKVLLTVVALVYAFFFVLALFEFPEVWGPLLHPEVPRFLISNLSMLINSALTGVLYLVIIYQLYRLIGLITRGDPFNQESPKRIRRIAYYTFGMAAINTVGESVRHISLLGFSSPNFWLSMTSTLLRGAQTVLFGVGILIIAFVLDVGVKLQQDQNLTV